MILDYIELIYNNVRRRKLRSWLTMIGIFIGIAAVVSLVSLGQGLQKAIGDEFEKMGTNKIIVSGGSGMLEMAFISLTDHDIEIIEKVKGVDMAAGLVYEPLKIKFNRKIRTTFVNGMPTDESRRIIEEMESFDVFSGRMLKQGDRYKAVIGYNFATLDKYFGKPIRLRNKIEIEGKTFEVVGLLNRIGNEQDDTGITIPFDTFREDIIDEPEKISIIMVEVKEGLVPADIAENIKKSMRKDRDLKEDEEDFSVQTFEQMLETFNTIFGIVQAVVIGIAAISLLVGGVGIMNTMYTSVLERTKEIGIMKAIGATNHNIMTFFLIESGMLGLFGGAIGIVIGVGIAKTVEYVGGQMLGTTYLQAFFSVPLILGAIAFSFIIGMLSGALPAYQASKLRPIEALRYE